MKIIHTSDWHLGKTLCGQSLIEDQNYFINNFFLPLVQEEAPDIVLISGDIFDRNIAPLETIRAFDEFIYKMSELKIPLFIITGNHDSRERIAVGTELLAKSGIHIFTSTGSFARPVEINRDGTVYRIFPLPYFSLQQASEYLDNAPESYCDAFAEILKRIESTLNTDDVNILAAHCFVAGSSVSESENPIYVGNSAQVSPALFKNFDYVALGHLHAPQFAADNIRYSGSPLKYSFDEEHHKKSVTIAEFNGKQVHTRAVEIPALHNVRTITGSFESISALGKETPSDDYIHIHITDEFPIFMPVDRLREFFPNILSLSCDYVNLSNEAKLNTEVRQSSDEEMFRQFMSQIGGIEPAEDEVKLFMSYLDTDSMEVI